MNNHYEGFNPFILKDFIKSKLELTPETPPTSNSPVSKSFAMSLGGNVSEVTLTYAKHEVDGQEEHVLGMDVAHMVESLKLLKIMGIRFYAEDLDSSHYQVGVVDGDGKDMHYETTEGFLNSYPTYFLINAIRNNETDSILSALEDN